MKRIVVVALILWLVLPRLASAQQSSTCAQQLRLARSIYENGRLHELPGRLDDCLKGTQFTTQERVDAYKLLTLAYIYLEEPEEADKMMLKILETDPEFSYNDNIDPAEFVALYKTFRTEPVYRLGVKGGANATQPNAHLYSPLNEGTEKYSYSFGFQAGVAAEIGIFGNKLTIAPELNYQVKAFKIENEFFENQHTTGDVTLSWISLPVSIQYPLPIKQKSDKPKWVPYVGAGASVDLLVKTVTAIETTIQFQSPVETSTTDKSQYKNFNIAPIVSAGVKGRVKKAEVIAEIRYNFGISTIFNKEMLYNSQSEVFGNKFVHGPFSINTLSLSFGYLMNKYIPKKKTSH
jgi:Outer membrane protein beta-barrel domain